MTFVSVPLCAAAHCQIRDQHSPICDNPDQCWGCLPRRAADGLGLCEICARRMGEDAETAARLHDDLLLSLRRSAAGEQTSGTKDRSPGVDGDVVEARGRIRGTLTALARMIVAERGIQPPAVGDELCGLGGWLAAQRNWLSAHPAAAEHAADLRGIAGDGSLWGLAYPTRRAEAFIGWCPMPVLDSGSDGGQRACDWQLRYREGQAQIVCGGCGMAGSPQQWHRWVVGEREPQSTVDAFVAASLLSQRWCREVKPSAVQQWAVRGRIVGVTRERTSSFGRIEVVPVRDSRGRAQYEWRSIVDYATRLWGDPAPVPAFTAA